MGPNGSRADEEAGADLRVAQAISNQPGDLTLPCSERQRRQRPAPLQVIRLRELPRCCAIDAIVAKAELDSPANSDPIAFAQHGATDALAIDEGAVGRAAIDDHRAPVEPEQHLGVTTRHGVVTEHSPGQRVASDEIRARLEGGKLLVSATKHFQTGPSVE